MQVRTSLQTDNHASTPTLFFTGRMPFLLPNQQKHKINTKKLKSGLVAFYDIRPGNGAGLFSK